MLKPCICGKQPEKVVGWRDRGLHPEMPWIKYSCTKNADGHMVIGPRADSPHLGWNENHPELNAEAERLWNEFVKTDYLPGTQLNLVLDSGL